MPTVTTAGDLRSRVVFSERITQPDALGNMQASWVERLTEAAQITPARGGEALDARRLEGRLVVTICVRSHSRTRKITPDWKVADQRTGATFNIRAVFDPEMGTSQHDRWIDVDAEAGGATG